MRVSSNTTVRLWKELLSSAAWHASPAHVTCPKHTLVSGQVFLIQEYACRRYYFLVEGIPFFSCVMCLTHTFEMPHPHMWHVSFMRVYINWTRSAVWHDSFTWLVLCEWVIWMSRINKSCQWVMHMGAYVTYKRTSNTNEQQIKRTFIEGVTFLCCTEACVLQETKRG